MMGLPYDYIDSVVVDWIIKNINIAKHHVRLVASGADLYHRSYITLQYRPSVSKYFQVTDASCKDFMYSRLSLIECLVIVRESRCH